MIVSPCISICRTDPVTGYCYGCARNNEEKRIWKDPATTDEWKNKNLKEIQERMNGWQLESFKESYDCLLYTSPSPRDKRQSRMPSSA